MVIFGGFLFLFFFLFWGLAEYTNHNGSDVIYIYIYFIIY